MVDGRLVDGRVGGQAGRLVGGSEDGSAGWTVNIHNSTKN